MKYCVFAITLLMAAALVLAPHRVCAVQRDSIDVVLVMDSSGSMKKTDPHSLRIPAAKLFISLLGRNDRAGVVSFSDSGYPIAYLTPIDSNEQRDRVLSAVDKISSNGLYTNLHDALSTGLEVLSGEGMSDRPRFIVLMSDGMMDVGDPDKDRELVDKVEDNLAGMLKEQGIKVYAIAFTEQSDRQLLERISKRTGGFYNLARTDKDLHMIFTSIFESLKQPEMLPMSENGFFIDKSVEEVTIVATKSSPATMINLKSPDGQIHTYDAGITGTKWFVSDNFDMITVSNPAEGRWEILFSTGKDNKAYIITNLMLHADIDRLHSTFGDPLELKIWLEKEGSVIVEQNVLDKIDIHVDLTSPDGKTTTLKPFSKGGGVYVRKITPFTPGNFKVSIVARGNTFEREKSIVFNVADIKESRLNIMEEREKKKASAQEIVQRPEENKPTDEISWGKVIVQFLSVNAVLCLIIFGYIKRNRLKSIQGLISGPVKKLSGLLGKKKVGGPATGSENVSVKEEAISPPEEDHSAETKIDVKSEETGDGEEKNNAGSGEKEDHEGSAETKEYGQEIAPEEGSDGAAVQEENREAADKEMKKIEEEAQSESEEQRQEIPLEEESEEEKGTPPSADHHEETDQEEAAPSLESVNEGEMPEAEMITDGRTPAEQPGPPMPADTDDVNTGDSDQVLQQEDLDQLLDTGGEKENERMVESEEGGDPTGEGSTNVDDQWHAALQEQKESESGRKDSDGKEDKQVSDVQEDRGAGLLEQEDLDRMLNTGNEQHAEGDGISPKEHNGSPSSGDDENIDDLWQDALKTQKEAGTGGEQADLGAGKKSALEMEIERLEKRNTADTDVSAQNPGTAGVEQDAPGAQEDVDETREKAMESNNEGGDEHSINDEELTPQPKAEAKDAAYKIAEKHPAESGGEDDLAAQWEEALNRQKNTETESPETDEEGVPGD